MATLEMNITSETGPDAPVVSDGRPENVPEEFWNAETKSIDTDALLAAYAAKATEAPAEGTEKAAEGEGTPEAEGAAEKAAEEAGVDIEAVTAHFEEHGEIPADAYEKLAKVGINKETVDEFVTLRKAQAETIRTEILNTVGGEEAVNAMLTWAGANWTDAQATAFNEATSTNDRAKIELALAGLKVAYDKANPTAPKRPGLVTPVTGKPSGGDTYASFAELRRDQADPRYNKDRAFRAQVEAKLKRSSFYR